MVVGVVGVLGNVYYVFVGIGKYVLCWFYIVIMKLFMEDLKWEGGLLLFVVIEFSVFGIVLL